MLNRAVRFPKEKSKKKDKKRLRDSFLGTFYFGGPRRV